MRVRPLSLGLILIGLSACQPKDPDAYVEKSWVRLAAVADQPAAAYFTLYGGAKDDALIAVHSDVVVSTSLHETMSGMGQGAAAMSMMKPLTSVSVPARFSAELPASEFVCDGFATVGQLSDAFGTPSASKSPDGSCHGCIANVSAVFASLFSACADATLAAGAS